MKKQFVSLFYIKTALKNGPFSVAKVRSCTRSLKNARLRVLLSILLQVQINKEKKMPISLSKFLCQHPK